MYSGNRLCGAVRAEADGEPEIAINCHCTNRRRATGAAYATLLFFEETKVRVIGKTAEYKHLSDRGSEMTKQFCPSCGSSMLSKNSARQGLIGLRAGTLNEAEKIHRNTIGTNYRPMSAHFLAPMEVMVWG